MKKISGAEAIIRCLISEDVDVLFGYPGGAIMPVYDELYKFQNDINHVLVRHEQGATHAAQGYADPLKGWCCHSNIWTGCNKFSYWNCRCSNYSTPMVCITGQVASYLLGSDAFQETDIIGISTPVTKWNYQITKASEISEIISKAFFIARTGRPGPVLIDITKDAQFDMIENFEYKKCENIRSYSPIPSINKSTISDAGKLINESKKPLIVWGQV